MVYLIPMIIVNERKIIIIFHRDYHFMFCPACTDLLIL